MTKGCCLRSSLLEGAKMARFLLCRWKPHHMSLFTLSDLGSHADCSAPSDLRVRTCQGAQHLQHSIRTLLASTRTGHLLVVVVPPWLLHELSVVGCTLWDPSLAGSPKISRISVASSDLSTLDILVLVLYPCFCVGKICSVVG